MKKAGVRIMKIQESGEDYLESILKLAKCKEYVRSIDVANDLSVTKPSVSRAMHILEERKFITIDEASHLHLTPEGKEIAEKMYERHLLFTDFLQFIGVDAQTAAEDACRIEHAISEESFSAMKAFIHQHMQK